MELQIEKLVYGGDGLARLPADEQGHGKTVFLPYVIPGELVDATLTQSRSGFVRARVDRILTPSRSRVAADCPYFERCGGCQYQHIDYEAQLEFKVEVLRETLRRTGKIELHREIQRHASPPWHYRNRTRVRLQHAPKFEIGYFRANTHELLAVEQCPLSSPLVNRALATMWDMGRAGQIPTSIHGMQFFASHDDSTLLVEVYVRPQSKSAQVLAFAESLSAGLPPVKGVAIFVASPVEDESRQLAPLTSVHNEAATVAGQGHLTYHAGGHDYRVSAGSFFQTNRFLVDDLVATAVGSAQGALALDLYAGVGLFTRPLTAKFQEVVAVEASAHSITDLRHNAPSGVKAIRATTEAFLAQQARGFKPDFILLDPPRAGLGEKATAGLGRTTASMVTLVSCDPATLSRDLRLLLESGFKVEQAHLLDLFPQTAHMETVLHLVR